MPLHWHYTKTTPFISQGKDTTRPNFSREERSEVGILIREGLQNPMDARLADDSGPVRVTMRNLGPGSFDSAYLERIFTKELRERLKTASGVDLPPSEQSSVFVIEDFGTKGLLGDIKNYNADGPDQNWNAFWHREGEGAKGRASNGGAGQGKVTYFSHSYASTVLGLTVRSTDMRQLLMGRAAFLRDYQFKDGSKYYRASYWTNSDDGPAPEEESAELDLFCKAFHLARNPATPGLSLVVPYAKPFGKRDAVVSVILDFYTPIVADRLQVMVGDVEITSQTIDDIADGLITDEEVATASSSFSKGYREFARQVVADPSTQVTLDPNWNKDRTIPEAAFPEGELAKLREQLDSGNRVAIKLPVLLRPRDGQSQSASFDVFIQVPPGLDRNEEAFIRRDLLIGAESHITAGSFVQKARSMTWIQERDLSEFLLTAEEPTHLKWNASLARDSGAFIAPDVVLRSIRQAVPRLLAILLSGSAKKDFKALARFFSRPAEDSEKELGGKGPAKKKEVSKVPPPPPPPPLRKPFRIESDGAVVVVVPNGTKGPEESQLPIRAVLELAYEGLDQDPFAAYDPYDFDVAQAETHVITAKGLSVTRRSGNQIEIDITQPDFKLTVAGFDPNVRTRARLNYEMTGATAGESEEDANG